MSDWMETIFSFLVFSSWQMLVLGALALTLTVLSRIRGHAAMWIFGMVLLYPCLSTLSYVIPSTSKVELLLPAVHSAPVFRTWTETRGIWGNIGSPASVPTDSIKVSSIMNTTTPLVPPWYRTVNWKSILTGLWLAGVVLLLIRIGLGFWNYRKLLQFSKPVHDPDCLRLFSDCVMMVKPGIVPRLAVMDYPCIPMIVGLFKPWIILPEHLLKPEKRDGLRFTLLHELAHLRRKDTLWLPIENAIGTLYFFHPAVHWVRRRIDREREYLCDRFVVQSTNKKASYADFLLNEVWESGQRGERALAIPLISKTSSVARRVHEIIQERKTTMFAKIRDTCLVSIIVMTCAAMLAMTYSPQAQSIPQPGIQQGDADGSGPALDHINAENLGRIGNTGLYHIMPNFESIQEVRAIEKAQPGDSRVLKPEDWTFNEKTNQLTVTAPVDDDNEMLIVYGTLRIPWAWRTSKPLETNSVKVILGDRLGERGVDFEVEEAEGLIYFLKEEFCDRSLNHYIAYGYKPEPTQPSNVSIGGAIGNHRDRKTVRRLMGIPEDPEIRAAIGQSVGMNGTPTDDPMVYNLSQFVEEKTMRVGIAHRSEPGNVNWLKKGVDYKYDSEKCQIILLIEIEIDQATHFLFLMAVPRNDIFIFHDLTPSDPIEFIVDGTTLKQDRDFTVDYSTGKIQLIDPNLIQRGTQYYISARNCAYGNYSPRPVSFSPDPEVRNSSAVSVGLNGTPTDDPMVYNLAQFVDEKSIGVAVSKMGEPGNLNWLKKGVDFIYDTETSKIHLLKKIEIDRETHYLYVQAVPRYDRFVFHDMKPSDSIELTVKGKKLVKDRDYSVDYSSGIIEILKPGLLKRGTKFSITVGETTFGTDF